MLPIRDENPTRSFPLLTILLLIANVLVFMYEAVLPNDQLNALIRTYGLTPRHIVGSSEMGIAFPMVTVFSHMFLHGGWFHLLGNMIYLWIFGNNIEDRLGTVRFALFYVLCGVGAAMAQIIIDTSSTIPMIGASGAISGLLGAYLILYPRASIDVLVPVFFFIQIIRLPAFFVILFWFVLQLANGLFVEAGQGGVAFFAHIGGFIAGLVIILFMPRRRRRPRIISPEW